MNRLLVLVFALCLSVSTAFAQDSKIGHIDFQELMLALPERSNAEQELQAFAAEYKNQLDGLKQEYEAKIAAAQNLGPETPDAILNSRYQEIQSLEQNILNLEQQANQDLAVKEGELLQPMYDRCNAAIKKVAEANGYTYILDTSSGVVLHAGGTDVSALVKAELGM